MPINYTLKVNERAIPQAITNEAHTVGIVGVFTVASGEIRLIEVPQGPAPAVTITGSGGPYNEITSGSPTGGQFLVNYSTGVVTFSTAQNGNSVLASYTGLGSEIAAEDINELEIPVGIALNADGSLSAGIVTTSSISNSAVISLTNLQTLNPSIVPVTNGSGVLTSSSTTATELGYVHGVTSNIQTQINALSSGTVSSITGTANEVIASSSTGAITLSLPQPIATTSSPTFASLTLTSPLTVANGGTGDATLTAYSVLTGGTTSTGAVQSVSGVGTTGQVLTSNGASTLPTWQTPSATGITALTGDVVTNPATLLGSAGSFAVLGDTAVTNTGSTVLTGDLGIYPGTSITGFPPGTFTGTEHIADATAAQAHTDATSAATTLKAMGPGTNISSTDLNGFTAVPGVYSATAAGTWTATGNLTLNGAGTYVFLFGTSLTIGSNCNVVLTGGATANNVYFVTGTFFTFGANDTINGNILAGTSITFAASSVLNGCALIYGPSGTTVTFPSAGTVTASGGTSGTAVTTVESVGGSSAANIHSAELLANAATSLDTPSTIVKRDASGNFAAGTITLDDQGAIVFEDLAGTASVTLEAPTTVTTSYTLNLPIAQGSSGQTLSNDGTGILSWVTPAGATYTAGTGITLTGSSFSLTAPVTIALGGTNSTTALTNNKVMISSSGAIIESGTTTTELGFVDATSSIQTQLNSKQSATLADANIWVGNGFNTATAVSLSGDATLSDTGVLTLSTVNSNVGSFTNANITVNAKGLITAASDGSASSTATSFQILASDPGSPTTAEVWFNSTDFQFKGYNGTSTVILG
jgi:hypothetical protein